MSDPSFVTSQRLIPRSVQLSEEKQRQVSEVLTDGAAAEIGQWEQIPLLRSDIDACTGRLNKAIENMLHMVNGQRVVRVRASDYFRGGLETQEQLEAAIQGLRDEIERHLGAGKKVLVQ